MKFNKLLLFEAIVWGGTRLKEGLKKTCCAFPFKFQSELIKYSFLKYLFPSKERRTLDAQIVFPLHRRFRNLIFASSDKGPLQFRTSTSSLPRDISASRSTTYWIGNCIRRMEKRNRNDGKKSLAWVEMALGGNLTMKYTHPFYYCRDLLLPLPRSELNDETFWYHFDIFV